MRRWTINGLRTRHTAVALPQEGNPPQRTGRGRRASRGASVLLSWVAAALALGLAGCPGPPPTAKAPTEPDLTADEAQRCAAGQDETSGNCTPEGCASPPEPEEGKGGSGAQEPVDCSKWDD